MEEKVNERVTIRLPEETLYRIDSFMRVNEMKNRSELIRIAVEYFLDRHKNTISPESMKFSDICVELPWRAALAMEYLESEGYVKASALEGMLQEKASEWVNEKASKYVGKPLDDILKEMEEQKRAEKEVMGIVRK